MQSNNGSEAQNAGYSLTSFDSDGLHWIILMLVGMQTELIM